MRKEQVEIKKLGINGEGIGYVNKKICFINNALPGEIVEAEIVFDNKRFLKGNVVKRIQSSPMRVATFCKDDNLCMGCALTSLDYPQHLPHKKGILKDALKKYTRLEVEKLPIRATIPSPVQKGYKKTVDLPITYFKGKVCFGIYQRESKYLTFMNHCAMQDPLINECLTQIGDIFNEFELKAYDDKTKKGLRFIKMRNIDGKIQVVIVTGTDGLNEDIIHAITTIKEVKSIFYTINTSRHQNFDSQGYKKVYGASNMKYEFLDQKYLFSIKSVFPINPEMEELKLGLMKSLIGENKRILSLSCGNGVLELALNNDVEAVDENRYHIDDANDNAKILSKHNVNFVCRDIDEAVVSKCKAHAFDMLIVRADELSPAIKKSLILAKIKEVIYVCDHPSSLAKDIEELKTHYKVDTIIPLDTYPYSSKLETITKLIRK